MPAEYYAALVCAWLASYFVHSTALLGAAWVVTRRLPSRFDRLAEQLWRIGLGVPVITTIGQQLAFLPANAAPSRAAVQYTPSALTLGAIPGAVWFGIAMVWIIGAAIGVANLALLQRSLRRAIGHRTQIAVVPRFSGQQSRTLTDVVRVSVVGELSVPLALASEVCLPSWIVRDMDAGERRAVLEHELAHVRRRDAIWRPLVATITRVFFFQPLNWVASVRLRELSECLCDEEAIHATNSTLPLASALETVAVRAMEHPAHLSLVPAMNSVKSFTLRRVRRILSSSRAIPGRPARSATVVAMAVGIAAMMLAPRVIVPAIAFMRYTINAQDPAGQFTLTVQKGKVIGATISGRALAARQVTQSGRAVKIVDPATGTFSLQLMPAGGVSWRARKDGT